MRGLLDIYVKQPAFDTVHLDSWRSSGQRSWLKWPLQLWPGLQDSQLEQNSSFSSFILHFKQLWGVCTWSIILPSKIDIRYSAFTLHNSFIWKRKFKIFVSFSDPDDLALSTAISPSLWQAGRTAWRGLALINYTVCWEQMAESSITTQAFATAAGESLVWVCKAVSLESYSSLATFYFITLFIIETCSYFPLELFWVCIDIKCKHCISRTFPVPDRSRCTLTPCFLSPRLLETGIFLFYLLLLVCFETGLTM